VVLKYSVAHGTLSLFGSETERAVRFGFRRSRCFRVEVVMKPGGAVFLVKNFRKELVSALNSQSRRAPRLGLLVDSEVLEDL
jgi:hypothetical protein